jgi:pimeloyl-ACP methyl ester carboxylesterase
MVPLKVGTNMSALIKNSETKVISNCGHMIIFEKAFEMRQLVKEFILKNKK